MQGVRRAQMQLGESICVLGLGLLGQLTVQLAKKAGCRVVGIDLIHDRLSLASTLGADLVLHATDHDVIQEFPVCSLPSPSSISKWGLMFLGFSAYLGCHLL